MRKPRLEDFDTSQPKHKPDEINIVGIVPLHPKVEQIVDKTVFVAPAQNTLQEAFARKPESRQTTQQAIGQARLPESLKARKPESLFARNLADTIQEVLNTKATKKESFRCPEGLMLVLEDLSYEVKKNYGKRVTKTAIFVAALASYLWEFKHKGEASLFYKQLIETDTA